MSDSNRNYEIVTRCFEEMIEGLQVIDQDWRYLYVNRAAATQGKSTPENLIGKTMMESYPGIEATPMFKHLEHVMSEKTPVRIENEFEYPDQKKCWFELYVEPHQFGILIRSIDISEKKKLEEQLRHSQKVEAIGRLAGGIAHDFNNKLAIIVAYSEMAIDKLANSNDQVSSYLRNILSAAQQSAGLTRQLLAFSRKQVLDLRVVNLNEMIESLRPNLSQLLGESIQIDYVLSKNLKNVSVDPAQMDQVILNLCINARDAMPEGGKLVLETRNVELDEAYAAAHPEVVPGLYVMISVSDTGIGMDKDVLSRIFEPYFTTKCPDRGTGLGLATVHGIVKQSNGHVWVYSEPGMGTAFKIYFPMVEESVTESAVVDKEISSYKGSETVLVVEDDPLLIEAYASALRGAGYEVLTASTPQAAQKVIQESKTKIDLMLTDLVLPTMNGKQLFESVSKQAPDLKVVYMSGYIENSIVHQGILDTESILIQKPVSIKVMLETLRKVLEGTLTKGIV